MAFTRPVVGADISAADFGQPVYDALNAMIGAWQPLAFAANWQNYGSGFPAFAIRSEQGGKVARLTGLVQTLVTTTQSANVISTAIPAALRPPGPNGQFIFTGIAESGGGTILPAQIRVTWAGALQAWCALNANSWVSLDGITWGL